ncbi:MAG: hypothetical protein ABWW65_02450 [Thermoprotei archaeon]
MSTSRLLSYLAGIVIIGIVIYLVLLYVTVQSLSASITSISSLRYDIGSNTVSICFKLVINNTGLIDVEIEKIYYRVYVENDFLGEGSREDLVLKRGSTTYDFCLKTTPTDAIKALLRIIVGRGRANITIEGYIRTPIKGFDYIKLWTVKVPYRVTREIAIELKPGSS